MHYTIRIEDPATPDVLALLEDGERYGAALYPAESNHFLPLEALRAQNIRFVVARDNHQTAVGTGAIALYGDWAELKRMWVVPACRGQGLSRRLLGALETLALEAGCGWRPASTMPRRLVSMSEPASHGASPLRITSLIR